MEGSADPADRLINDFRQWLAKPPLGKVDEGDLVYFIDLGSLISLHTDIHDIMVHRMTDVVTRVRDLCRHDWCWWWDDQFSRGPRVDLINLQDEDFRRSLWIKFDSKDDALLCRMTIGDLRNARHANCGRLSQGAER